MALPTQLFQDDEDDSNNQDAFNDNNDAIAIPADFHTLLNHANSVDTEIELASEQVTSGDVVPSWKNSALGVKPAEEAHRPLVERSYKPIGELSAETVINTPYDKFRHLEGIVQDITKFVQKQLSDNDRLNDITEARARKDNKHEEMVRYLDQMILNHMTRQTMAGPEDTKIIVAMVINEILGLGPIQPLWGDPDISEIMINGHTDIRIEKKGKIQRAKGIQFRDQAHLVEVCQQILGEIGRRIDKAHPLEDGRLNDMSRINVTHPAVGPNGPYVTIRRFSDTAFSMEKLVSMKSMSEEMAEIIGNLVYTGYSIVIAGATGTGKTSMLNALSGCISNDARIITIEDNLELRLHPDKFVSALEARPASASGEGAITIRDLVKNTLRMRPDRIIVGEIRDASAYDMLQSMNTGHDGSLTTVHAEDAVGAIERLRNLVDQEGSFNAKTALTLIAGGVDLFITIARYDDGSRRISGVYEVPRNIEHLDHGEIRLDPIPLWEFVHESTTASGEVIGHYEKMNEISEQLIRRHRLDRRRKLSLEEIYELSKVEERVKPSTKDNKDTNGPETHGSVHNVDMSSAAPKRPSRPTMPSLTDFNVTKPPAPKINPIIHELKKPIVVESIGKPKVLEIEESIVVAPIEDTVEVIEAPVTVETISTVETILSDDEASDVETDEIDDASDALLSPIEDIEDVIPLEDSPLEDETVDSLDFSDDEEDLVNDSLVDVNDDETDSDNGLPPLDEDLLDDKISEFNLPDDIDDIDSIEDNLDIVPIELPAVTDDSTPLSLDGEENDWFVDPGAVKG